MFGGGNNPPSKNPFSKSSNIFGQTQEVAKPATSRKRGNESSSGLYGMPPIPQAGQAPPLFATRKNVEEPLKKSSNIFSSALKSAVGFNQNPSNIFAKPFAASTSKSNDGKDKPDLFKSIEAPAAKNIFQAPAIPEAAAKNPLTLFQPPSSSIGSAKPEVFTSFKRKAGEESQAPTFNPFKPVDSKAAGSFLKSSSFKPVENLPLSANLKSRLGARKEEPIEHQEVEESDEEKTESPPRFQRLTSREELQSIKSIVCEQVPAQALNKKVLEKHFAKFGNVNKVVVNLKKSTAIVHFDDHKSAKKAKEKGQSINPQIPSIGAIFYRRVKNAGLAPEASANEPATEEVKVEKPKFKLEDSRNLMQIVKSQALNDNDKYAILDARDKLLREKKPPKAGGGMRLQGHCPDICPEKERYSRAVKNQLRVYEKFNGMVNHKATLKEYSRSSADQEIPMLHELRPSNVLQIAMNHLLCNVIDRIEMDLGSIEDWYDNIVNGGSYPEPLNQSDNGCENVGEWFEYTWSTTRAIRKDITQQDLTKDPLAVDLMEKCARFHIMCAERLIEEGPHDFDKKLNDENLTKCIQTLKHMYYDMSIEGVQCPNEAEFRAYDVLLNLNDGDTLRSIQTLDNQVRTSQPIKFAIDALTAVNNNNYIRFFKLVKKASLLQGCILLRYFDQVRQKALETIVKAYCPGKSVVQYSLSKLTFMLGFESLQDCSSFCNQHGLSPEMESDCVYMEKSSFFYPESSRSLKRAKNLVESKRLTQWSVVINGNQPLPSNTYLTYVPHDSFDSEGYLKPQALDGSDQSSLSGVKPTANLPEIVQEQAKKSQEMAIVKAMEQVANEMLNEVILEQSIKQSQTLVVLNQSMFEMADNVENEVLKSAVLQISQEVLKKARNEEIQRRLDLEAKNALAEQVQADLLNEVIDELIKDIGNAEIARMDKLNQYLNLCPQVVEELIGQVLQELLQVPLDQVLNDCMEEREAKIRALKQRQEERCQRRFFKSWLKYVRKRKSQRDILQKFPCIPSSLKTNEQLKCDLKAYSLKETLSIKHQVDKLHNVIDLEDKFVEHSILEPMLGLPALLKEKGIKQWKIVVTALNLEHSSIGKGLVEMTKKKLSIAINTDQDHDSNLLCCFSTPDASLAVRWIDNDMIDEDIAYSDKKRRDYLTGTCGLLFIHVEEEETVEEGKARLDKFLQFLPKVPKVALVILTTSQHFQLDQVPFGVAEYAIVRTNVDIFQVPTIVSVEKSVETLVSISQPFDLMRHVSDLNFKLIRDYVEDFLVGFYFNQVYIDLSQRSLHVNPNVLIKLFNEIIEHLINVLNDQDLQDLSWPIPELKHLVLDEEIPSYWNEISYLEQVTAWIANLKLPLMTNIKHVDDLDQYLSLVCKSYSAFSLAHCRIDAALKKVRRKNLNMDQVPWTDIVHALIDYKLEQRSPMDPYSSHGSDMVVVFFNHHLESFQYPKFWQQAVIERQPVKSNIETTDDTFNDKENKSELFENIQSELNASLQFEKNLEKMVMNEDYVLQDNDHQQAEHDDEQLVLERTSIHVPVVSMLSPSLALVAGSRSLQQRIDIYAKKKRSIEQVTEDKQDCIRAKKVIKSHLVQSLHDKAQEEVKASANFEQKLLAALNH